MQLFHLGQIVVPDFFGLERQMYQMHNKDFRNLDHFLEKEDIGIVLEIIYEDNKKNCWLKLLTNNGIIGCVPSIWMKSA